MAYVITDKCIICRSPYGCIYNCPAEAIHFNGVQSVIDQDKCIGCGLCAKNCYLHAIEDTEHPEPAPIPHEPIVRECDILVIGGGAAGLTAALKASENTDGKIIVLEAGKSLGGGGAYCAGIRLFGTKWEKDAGIPDQFDDYVRTAMNTTRGLLDPKLVEACYKAVPGFFDWFCAWGDAEEGFELDPAGGFNGCYIRCKKHDYAGRFITEKMIRRIHDRNIECLTETTVTDFIMENGKLVGVTAQDSGGDLAVRGKAILIASGNVGNSRELHERCVPEYADAFQRKSQHLLPTCTGDLVLKAEAAGLPVDLDSIVPAYLGSGCGGNYHTQLLKQPDRADILSINLNGKRFYNEQQRGSTFSGILLKQPKCVVYKIMDVKLLNAIPVTPPKLFMDPDGGRMISNGVPNLDGTPKTPSSFIKLGFGRDMPADPKCFGPDAHVQEQVDELTKWEGGYVFKADTLEELAEKMGVPVDAFLETVRRYNELCKKGRDDDFYKPSELMVPIETAPFYAFHEFLPSDGTFGGFAVNSKTQLIHPDGTPVPGVWAAGDTTGSRYANIGGEKKQIINDYSWAVASGYIAGAEMAAYINSMSSPV